MKIKIILFVEIYGHISKPRGNLCFNPWQILDMKFNFKKIRSYVIRKTPIHSLSNIIINKYVSKHAAAQVRTTVFIVYMSQKISEKLHFLCKIYKDTAGVESSTIIYIERILVLCVIDKNTNWINGFEHLSCVPCNVVICVHQYFDENNIR